jgi:hypothetical protein
MMRFLRKKRGERLRYENREYSCFYDRGSGRTFSDIEFYRCHFVSCAISLTLDPRRRSTLRNIKFIQCEQHGCALESAIVENVIVDGLITNGILRACAAVFKHVIFRGKIERIMISPIIAPGKATPDQQKAFNEANKLYYSTIDWALDIREAEFIECDIRGIPARLIKRDPETQVIVKRESALQGKWHELDLSGTYWPASLELFLKRGEKDLVLVAPKRHPKYKIYLNGLNLLRDAGVAEPD